MCRANAEVVSGRGIERAVQGKRADRHSGESQREAIKEQQDGKPDNSARPLPFPPLLPLRQRVPYNGFPST